MKQVIFINEGVFCLCNYMNLGTCCRGFLVVVWGLSEISRVVLSTGRICLTADPYVGNV
jgi:hypothetical protein